MRKYSQSAGIPDSEIYEISFKETRVTGLNERRWKS
jgi:hypothetical protein